MQDDYKNAWGVCWGSEGLDVRTVSPTRRAAIINWLVVVAGILVTSNHNDDQINAMWEAYCGDAIVIPVRCYAQA